MQIHIGALRDGNVTADTGQIGHAGVVGQERSGQRDYFLHPVIDYPVVNVKGMDGKVYFHLINTAVHQTNAGLAPTIVVDDFFRFQWENKQQKEKCREGRKRFHNFSSIFWLFPCLNARFSPWVNYKICPA